MNIHELIEGKEYVKTHAYGQPNQKVKILKVSEKDDPKWGKYWEATVQYTSDDATKGMVTGMNTIECERYLREI